jgi:hypothetical protein
LSAPDKTIETAANIVEVVFNGFAIMRINRDLDSLEDARYERRDAAKAFYDALANPSTATDAQRAEKFKKYVVAQDDVDFYQTRTIETHLQTLYVATGASAVKVLGSLQGVSSGAYLEDSSGANSLLTAAGLGCRRWQRLSAGASTTAATVAGAVPAAGAVVGTTTTAPMSWEGRCR